MIQIYIWSVNVNSNDLLIDFSSQNSKEISCLFYATQTKQSNEIAIFNILTSQKRQVTQLKSVWPVNMTSNCPKIVLSTEPK